MTVYYVVITSLLVIPWLLVGVTVMGAVWSVVSRSLEGSRKESHSRWVRSAAPRRRSRGGETSRNERPADEVPVGHSHDSARRAA